MATRHAHPPAHSQPRARTPAGTQPQTGARRADKAVCYACTSAGSQSRARGRCAAPAARHAHPLAGSQSRARGRREVVV